MNDNLRSSVRNLNQAIASPAPATIRVRSRLPFVWLLLLLAAALLVPDRIWTALLVALIGLLGIAYTWTRLLGAGLEGARSLQYGWVAVGDRLQEAFALRNASPVPAYWVELEDESNVPGYRVSVTRSLGSFDQTRWKQAAVCTRRGRYRLGPWRLRTGDPFGFFEVERRYETSEEIIIHPPIVTDTAIPLPPGQNEGRSRMARQAWQANINSAGVRDYRPHDPLQRIHWPTTARRDTLMVKEFDQDAAGDIWLLLDCEAAVQLGEGAEGTLEKAVLLAASLAANAQAQHRQLGIATFGLQPHLVGPGLGRGHHWRILRALALVEADGAVSLGRALDDLSTEAERGAAAMIITPSDSADWLPSLLGLARHAIEGHVLLFNRTSFGAEGHSYGLQQTIQSLGFSCQIIDSDAISAPQPAEQARGFWEFRVTGTGKAIAVSRPGG